LPTRPKASHCTRELVRKKICINRCEFTYLRNEPIPGTFRSYNSVAAVHNSVPVHAMLSIMRTSRSPWGLVPITVSFR
jgi:hypothetical protein